MKFGREFRIHLEKTLPEWRSKYLCYKLLKKLLKNIPSAADNLQPPALRLPLPELQVWFVAILSGEVKKFNDFYVGKEEDLIIRFQRKEITKVVHPPTSSPLPFKNPNVGIINRLVQALKETIERVKEREGYYGVFTSETEFSEDMTEICKDLVVIHGEMVLLKSYSSLNFAGLIKILKKYDKRTGAMLSLPFTQLAFHQPFFTTEPLTRLIHECEANLELLFPLEAEVVESTEIGDEHTGTPHADRSNASLETTLLLVEETVDIYRRTVDTISTIECIKKESSSINPLSMSNLFRRRDNDNMGAVTAENSPCNSFASFHDLVDEIVDISPPE